MGRASLVAVLSCCALLAAPSSSGAQPAERWVAGWGVALVLNSGNSAADATYRLIARPSVSGSAVRIRLSNPFGTKPIRFNHVTIGVRVPDGAGGPARGASVEPGSLRDVSFDGGPSVTIDPEGSVISDPVSLPVRAGTDLAVSVHVPEAAPMSSHDDDGLPTNTAGVTQYATVAGAGDQTSATSGSGFGATGRSIAWLDEVDVLSPAAGVVVALGDSITAGATASLPENQQRHDLYDRYTDFLAERFRERGEFGSYGVVNAGIGNNTLTGAAADTGPTGLERLDSDVLSRTAVSHVIMLLGTNDLTYGQSAHQIIDGFKAAAAKVRGAGIKLYGGTIMPRGRFNTPTIEAGRQELNQFIRTSGLFDGVVDFDAITRDPANPTQLYPPYDDGDGVHPTPAGYRAMAQGIDLAMFPAPVMPEGVSTARRSRARMTVRARVRGRAIRFTATLRPRQSGCAPARGVAIVRSGSRPVAVRSIRFGKNCAAHATVNLRRKRLSRPSVRVHFFGDEALLPTAVTAKARR